MGTRNSKDGTTGKNGGSKTQRYGEKTLLITWNKNGKLKKRMVWSDGRE